jgi:succinoglycan biosynthesis transport protein ExoP
MANLVALGIARAGSVHTASAPVASAAPIRPRPVLNIAVAMMLGLVGGFAIAWLRTVLDTRLHSADEAEQMLDVAVLASIPLRKQPSREDPVLREAYDVLRANLTFLALDGSLKVLTVTSHSPGEGKTSTLDGLAQAVTRTGSTALLIDGDVRTRALSTRYGRQATAGLTNVIARVDIPLQATSGRRAGQNGAGIDAIESIAPGLDLLAAGTIPPNPPSLLGSERMEALIAQLRDSYDTILIDTPPSSNLADASILSSLADGVILVGRVGMTKRADLQTVAMSLRHGPTPIVGVVILEPRAVDMSYYESKYIRSPRTSKAVSSS